MTTITKHGYDEKTNSYFVVHPLDDIAERKIDMDTLGPLPMTTAVKLSLFALRGYLILMFLLVLYRVAQISGLFGNS